jgi:DNA-binding NarL/FixJ family response regulator
LERSARPAENGDVDDALRSARAAFRRKAWRDAYERFSAAGPLDAPDRERLAVAAHLVGADAAAARAWELAHRARLTAGDPVAAARCAFWLGLDHLLRGDLAHAGGWLARAERCVDAVAGPCAPRGLLLIPKFLDALGRGDIGAADTHVANLTAIADECDDDDLRAFARLARGQLLVANGDAGRGLPALDDVMISVTSGELSPMCAGIVYCAVIEACMDAYDVRRAAEWTDALSAWCAAQPDLVQYRGQCLVHRAQVFQAHGAWTDALAEAERARHALAARAHPALGLAWYQQGELHRLRGELREAETAYRAAREHGREPVPGAALLRLAAGDLAAAVAAARRMLAETNGATRAPVLAAAVEIFLAEENVAAARDTANELASIAGAGAPPLLVATAAYAHGVVLLAEGDAPRALAALRTACAHWHELAMPYETARARTQLAVACRALGDHDTAELELDTARTVFARVGAAPDLARLARLGPQTADVPCRLTTRECEVLRRVASGMTNREIASVLTISEHTVARHLQNIFAKLGISSRAAATAYAYEHRLV